MGDLDGEIVLVEFADYECPFCRSAHDEVTALLRERSDVTFVFRHFPIDKIHPNAVWGASLSVCAEAVGRFESMHHLLMTTDGWREGAAPNEVAREAGIVDFSEFEACLEAPATLERIKRDSRLGAELGIAGTPTWFGAGGAISGLVDRSTLSGLLQ